MRKNNVLIAKRLNDAAFYHGIFPLRVSDKRGNERKYLFIFKMQKSLYSIKKRKNKKKEEATFITYAVNVFFL